MEKEIGIAPGGSHVLLWEPVVYTVSQIKIQVDSRAF